MEDRRLSGARIFFEFRHEAFTAALARLDISNPARRRGLLRAIGVGLQHTTRDRFERGADPQGRGWAPLHPAYAAARRPMPILQQMGDSGGLKGSITFQTASHQVAVGSNKVYAAIHQFGGVIRPNTAKALAFQLGGHLVRARRVTIPARPYLGFGRADEEAVLDAVDVLLPGGRAASRI